MILDQTILLSLSVLAYIAQEAVDTFHWLLPGEMLDGLGLAETTPQAGLFALGALTALFAAIESAGLKHLWWHLQ